MYHVKVEGRTLKTPKGLAFEVESQAVAEAIMAEWVEGFEDVEQKGYGDCILTALVATAIDRVPEERPQVTGQLVRVCENDQTLAWVAGPEDLLQKQRAQWEPLVEAVNKALGLRLKTRFDLSIPGLSEGEEKAIQNWSTALNDIQLVAFSFLCELSHSFVVPYSLISGLLETPLVAWDVAELHERDQCSRWGEDREAHERDQQRQGAFIKAFELYSLA